MSPLALFHLCYTHMKDYYIKGQERKARDEAYEWHNVDMIIHVL
jgi:hypothetical protein